MTIYWIKTKIDVISFCYIIHKVQQHSIQFQNSDSTMPDMHANMRSHSHSKVLPHSQAVLGLWAMRWYEVRVWFGFSIDFQLKKKRERKIDYDGGWIHVMRKLYFPWLSNTNQFPIFINQLRKGKTKNHQHRPNVRMHWRSQLENESIFGTHAHFEWSHCVRCKAWDRVWVWFLHKADLLSWKIHWQLNENHWFISNFLGIYLALDPGSFLLNRMAI